MKRSLLLLGAVLVVAALAAAAPMNVTLNKPVTLNGSFGVAYRPCCLDPSAPLADPSTLVDGVFLPAGTDWQSGTVWWDQGSPQSLFNNFEVNLQGLFTLTGVVIQADNNDRYQVDVWMGGSWVPVWTAPIVPGSGMNTRPDPNDNSALFAISPVQTDRIRVMALEGAGNGDGFASVSEIQAWGEATQTGVVPEPGTNALIGAGLCLAALVARRRRATS
ncbi:MAG: PEP-CTERM sorting domain-containing protein [Bryobacteraceae bacterium]|nr:PEP-CTERM sorting domain-containing protein [Bryobacteraceae bacterium]